MKQPEFGVIFDWDGVVVDSAAQHRLAWEKLAKEKDLPLSPGHFERGFGRKSTVIISEILSWTQDPIEIKKLSDRKEALYRDILKEAGLNPLPGVKQLLCDLQAAHIPCAIASSTARENLNLALKLLGLEPMFKEIVSAEDVSEGKPNPAVFLKAAALLGLEPKQCLVIEDAPVGIDAALNGGFCAIAVATSHPISTFFRAHRAVASLDDLALNDLRLILQRAALAPI